MSRKQTLPTKTALNLVINEIPRHYYRNLLITSIVVALAILAFAKFAVIDKLSQVDEEWRITDVTRVQVEMLVENNSDYFEVLEKYTMYFASNSEKGAAVNVMEVLRIVDEHLRPAAEVSSVSLVQNTLSVSLGGITLNDATDILLKLYETEPLVASVDIFTASSPEGERSSISMTIALNPQGGVE